MRLSLLALLVCFPALASAQGDSKPLPGCDKYDVDYSLEIIGDWEKLLGILGVAEQISDLHREIWDTGLVALREFASQHEDQWGRTLRTFYCAERAFNDTLVTHAYADDVKLLLDWFEFDESGIAIARAMNEFRSVSQSPEYWESLPPDVDNDRLRILVGLARTPIFAKYQITLQNVASEMYEHINQFPNEPELKSYSRSISRFPDELFDAMARNYLARAFVSVSDEDLNAFWYLLLEEPTDRALNVVNRGLVRLVKANVSRVSKEMRKHIPTDQNVAAVVFGDQTPETELAVRDEAQATELVAEAQAMMSPDRTEAYSPKRVVDSLTRVLAFDSENARAHGLLGIAALNGVWTGQEKHQLPRQEFDSERLEFAKSHLTKALELDPAQDDVRSELGYVEFNQGNLSIARQHLETAVQNDASYSQLFVYLGHLELQEGNKQQSLRNYFRTFVDSHPSGHYAAAQAILDFHFSRDNIPEISEKLRSALDRGSISRLVAVVYGKSQLYVQNGDLTAAVGFLKDKEKTKEVVEQLSQLYIAQAHRFHTDSDGFPDAQGSELIQRAASLGQALEYAAYRLMMTPHDHGASLTLIKAGVDLDQRDPLYSTQLLEFAVRRYRNDTARGLAELGVPVQYPGRRLQPLHAAVQNGNVEGVALLLEHGAQLDVIDRIGRRPADLLEEAERNYPKVAEELRVLLGASN